MSIPSPQSMIEQRKTAIRTNIVETMIRNAPGPTVMQFAYIPGIKECLAILLKELQEAGYLAKIDEIEGKTGNCLLELSIYFPQSKKQGKKK